MYSVSGLFVTGARGATYALGEPEEPGVSERGGGDKDLKAFGGVPGVSTRGGGETGTPTRGASPSWKGS